LSIGSLVVILIAAFVAGVGGTLLAKRFAPRLGMVDHPAERKDHKHPTPLLGGLAIYVAVIAAVLLLPNRKELVELAGILVGGSLISFCGLWDDRWGLNPYLKLAVQLVATALLIASGVQVQLPVPLWANLLLTALWVVGITNGFNLLDNMDGLAGGVGVVAAAYFLLMAAMNGQYLVGSLAAGLLGACLGFLLFNFNPARVFMGDSGSLFLGFMMAVVGIKLRFPANTNWVTWMVPILVLGVPIFDTTLVVVSRLRRGKNPLTTPGKDHLSHRLLLLGWTRRETALLHYLAGSTLGGLSLFVSLASPPEAYAMAGILLALTVTALVWFEKRASPA
jgi:UDP-GlcNAc:undecaprenyl-phosphate GlcNAc-1-phosphate transferase